MKNIKMLILSMMAALGMVSGLNAEKIDWTPYATGNGLDENGRNLYHILADNCDVDGFEEQLDELDRVMTQSSDAEKLIPSATAIDKNGDTPLHLAMRRIMQSRQSNYRCHRMVKFLLDGGLAERNTN